MKVRDREDGLSSRTSRTAPATGFAEVITSHRWVIVGGKVYALFYSQFNSHLRCTHYNSRLLDDSYPPVIFSYNRRSARQHGCPLLAAGIDDISTPTPQLLGSVSLARSFEQVVMANRFSFELMGCLEIVSADPKSSNERRLICLSTIPT
jgi:hypothetical protein